MTRWKWILLALVPSILSNLLLLVSVLISLNGLGSSMWLLYGIFFMPFVFPVYLYPVGRRYVRAVHGGFFNNPLPFVLIYSVANLVVWACGVSVVIFNMHTPG